MAKDERCGYYVAKQLPPIEYPMIEERFDFQIGENGQIERVSLGEFDLVKEVQSHKGEVGLINCLKLAEARGIDPITFAKTEPGIMADIGDVDTLDDLIKAKAAADAKLSALAAQYGITTEKLIAALKDGSIATLKELSPESAPEGE